MSEPVERVNQLPTGLDGEGPARPPRLTGRRRWLVVGVAGAIVASSVGGVLWSRRGGEQALGPTDPSTVYKMAIAQSGTDFTMAMNYIDAPGQDITVLEVSALTSANVEYLGAFTVWPRDFITNKLSAGPKFPPPELTVRHPIGEVVPAAETSVLPAGATEPPALTVAAGFRLISGTMGAVNGVRVVYKVGNKKVSEVFDQALIVCVKPLTCRTPAGVDFADYEDQVLRQFGLLPKES